MKRIVPLIVCAVLAALLVAEAAPAVTVEVDALQGQPAKRDIRDYTGTNSSTPALWAENSVQSESRLRVRPSARDAWMTWLQFDISDVWAENSKDDLLYVTLNISVEAGTSTQRRWCVYGIKDGQQIGGQSAENWSETTLTWNNAPANNLLDTLGTPDLNMVYGGYYLDLMAAQNLAAGTFWWKTGQTLTGLNYAPIHLMADYIATDTDGLVTFILANLDTCYLSSDEGALTPFLTFTFIPEPTTLAILGLGGMLLRRRIA